MKKRIFIILTISLGGAALLMNGCKKSDDTAAPVITLSGGDLTVPMNTELSAAQQYLLSDKGATTDDGSLVSSSYGPLNPNTDLVGVYTINYTATDHAGNVGRAHRTVTVTETPVGGWLGTYARANIIDSIFIDSAYTVFGAIYTWGHDMQITQSNSLISRAIMDPFADNITLSDKIAAYVPGPDTAGGPIAIPFQNPQSSFLPTYPINTYPRVDTIYRSHTFMGSGNYYVAPNPGIMLNYTDLDSIIVITEFTLTVKFNCL
jgi:hypothetical protein